MRVLYYLYISIYCTYTSSLTVIFTYYSFTPSVYYFVCCCSWDYIVNGVQALHHHIILIRWMDGGNKANKVYRKTTCAVSLFGGIE